VLANAGANVCDLQTRLAGELYVMIMDVAVPPGTELPLQDVARDQDVKITVRPVEPDVL